MKNIPKALDYYFPAEWEKHEATWLSWPHKEASWPGKIKSIYPVYCQWIKLMSEGEKVRINVSDEKMMSFAKSELTKAGVENFNNIEFYFHTTNDAWCRDHGPAFLVNPKAGAKKIVVNWGYNAWGGKYPPHDLDDVIPSLIAKHFRLSIHNPGIIMEGGSVDFNGKGTVLTTTSCLLNPNRNPSFSQQKIEQYLQNFYGVDQVLWLNEGIEGDDTDGHIDDITRFVNSDTVITMVEPNKQDNNHAPLDENLKALKNMRLLNDKQLNVIEIPMPAPILFDGQRLPASYANFYIANNAVYVPTFNDKNDQIALDTLEKCFPDRKVVGLNSVDIIWGLGSFHCLSQQEPFID